MANGGPEVTLGMSNLNVSVPDALRFRADDYLAFMHAAGYDTERSVEVTPTRIPRMMQAMGKLAAADAVSGLHESWRETPLRDVARAALRGRLSEATGAAAVVAGLPLLDNSYYPLQRIQEAGGGRRYPLIVHPPSQRLGDHPPRRPRVQYPEGVFGPIRVQLTPEDIDAHHPGILKAGIQELADAIAHINHLRDTEVVADLHHVFMTRAGKSFGDEARVTALLRALHERGAVAEWQLSFRPDFGGEISDLQQVANGRLDQTPQGRTLTAIRDVPTDRPLHLVSEVRASSIGQLDLPPGATYDYVHGKLTDSARILLAA